MNILILGSEGLIGKPLSQHLSSKGHRVIPWDIVLGGSYDLSSPLNWNKLFDTCIAADKIIFLAFNVGGSKYLEQHDKSFNFLHTNTGILYNTFDALYTSSRPFLFASSQMSNMYHTSYGLLKDLGERLTRSIDTGWICRFWNVFGSEDPCSQKSHVITDFIHMAKKLDSIKMRTTGEEKRQFLHTSESSLAIEGWIDGKWDDRSKYYDITSFKWTSIRDIALIIAQKYNIIIELGNSTDEIQHGIMNEPEPYIKRFWKPELTIEQGIDLVSK